MQESSKPWGNAAEMGADTQTQFHFKTIFQKGPINHLNMISFWKYLKFHSSCCNTLQFNSSLHLVPVIIMIIISSQHNEISHRHSFKSCY